MKRIACILIIFMVVSLACSIATPSSSSSNSISIPSGKYKLTDYQAFNCNYLDNMGFSRKSCYWIDENHGAFGVVYYNKSLQIKAIDVFADANSPKSVGDQLGFFVGIASSQAGWNKRDMSVATDAVSSMDTRSLKQFGSIIVSKDLINQGGTFVLMFTSK
jgi:hypothetical protein